MNPLRYIGWRLLAFVVLLGGLELYLRNSTSYGRLVVTERDGHFGWRMLPDQARWAKTGDIPEVINSYGYRDREWDESDDPTPRVAVLGQSMTYGTSVAIEDTWPRVLEGRLGDDSQVMNFAVQGYVLEQMVLVYESDVRPFKPDVVLLPMHMGDILPMGPAMDEFDFRYRTTWFRTSTRDLLNREVAGKWMPRPKPPVRVENPAAGLKDLVRDDPRSPALFKTWSEAGGHLNALQERVAADGARLAVVVLPTLGQLMNPERPDPSFQLDSWAQRRLQVHPESPVPIVLAREEFAAAQDVLTRDLLKRFEILERLPSDENGMRILPPGLAGFEDRLFLEQDVGHYSPRGHGLLGEVVHEAGIATGLWR